MLPFKSHLIVCAVSLIIGLGAGYSIRDEKADLANLEAIKTALQSENQNLLKQLEVEHEYTKTASESSKKAQEDLAVLEVRYADIVAELNTLQLSQLTYDIDDTSALSEDSGVTCSVPQSTSKCIRPDSKEFQDFTQTQLMIDRDCDITATYYNRLIELYESIQEKN